jgi:inner membrane protein
LDNLTHSLIGLVAGEAAARVTRTDPAGLPADSRRTTLLVMGMVGGNLPDIDLLWSMQPFSGDALGYLLDHRGYTHTLLGCAAMAALLYGTVLAGLGFRKRDTGPGDRRVLGVFALFAVLLHLAMDAFNSYGVHPFWPWNNHWYYGDAVFIVEPLYWIAAAPLFLLLRTIAARVFLALALVVGSAAILFVHGFAWRWWLVPAAALMLAGVGRPLRPSHASLVSASLMILVTVIFAASASVASERVAVAARVFTGFHTLDQVLTPSPAQPFCWDVLLLQRREDEYVVHHGRLNLAPPSSCPSVFAGTGTAPMTPTSSVAPPDGVQWQGTFAMSRARLVTLAQSTCGARELMQFVRAPFAAETSAGWILGDLRFDRERGLGLAELLIKGAGAVTCPERAPWIAPRADLLAR